jgi:Sugar (and other) transporter
MHVGSLLVLRCLKADAASASCHSTSVPCTAIFTSANSSCCQTPGKSERHQGRSQQSAAAVLTGAGSASRWATGCSRAPACRCRRRRGALRTAATPSTSPAAQVLLPGYDGGRGSVHYVCTRSACRHALWCPVQCSPCANWRADASAGAQAYTVLVVVAMLAYLAAFSPGMSPVPWAVNAEIYPQQLRGLANGAATASNWLANAAVSLCTAHNRMPCYYAMLSKHMIVAYSMLPQVQHRWALLSMIATYCRSARRFLLQQLRSADPAPSSCMPA